MTELPASGRDPRSAARWRCTSLITFAHHGLRPCGHEVEQDRQPGACPYEHDHDWQGTTWELVS